MVDMVIRVAADHEKLPYEQARVRARAGSVVDYLPEGAHPGNAVIQSPRWRIVRVPDMQEAEAKMFCAEDQVTAEDIAARIKRRYRLWIFNLSAVRFPSGRAFPDLVMTAAQFRSAMHPLPPEGRALFTGRPIP